MHLGVYIVFILPFNIYVIYAISYIYDIFICTYVETYKETHDIFPAVIIKKLFKSVALNEYRVVLLNFGNYVFFTILVYMHTMFFILYIHIYSNSHTLLYMYNTYNVCIYTHSAYVYVSIYVYICQCFKD